jgi:hypothetical protein
MSWPLSLARTLAWAALYLAATLSFALETGRLGTARAPDLARLPQQLGPLRLLEEIPFEPSSLGERPPERSTFRRVLGPGGEEGRLFVAWYARSQRWSGRPHDLEKCYAALGWCERDVRRLDEAHRPWVRSFERMLPEGPEAIRVVHWLEHPGPDGDRLDPAELLTRLRAGRGLRPDVASVYFEFPASETPCDADLRAAVSSLSAALEDLW